MWGANDVKVDTYATDYVQSVTHTGTASDPYTAQEAQYLLDHNQYQDTTLVYITGTVAELDSQTGNFYLALNRSDSIYCYALYNIKGMTNDYRYGSNFGLSEMPFEVGDTVVVLAYIKIYNNSLQEIANSTIISVNGIEVPEYVVVISTQHEGTMGDPYTLSDLLLIYDSMEDDSWSDAPVYMVGTINNIFGQEGCDYEFIYDNNYIYARNVETNGFEASIGNVVTLYGYLYKNSVGTKFLMEKEVGGSTVYVTLVDHQNGVRKLNEHYGSCLTLEFANGSTGTVEYGSPISFKLIPANSQVTFTQVMYNDVLLEANENGYYTIESLIDNGEKLWINVKLSPKTVSEVLAMAQEYSIGESSESTIYLNGMVQSFDASNNTIVLRQISDSSKTILVRGINFDWFPELGVNTLLSICGTLTKEAQGEGSVVVFVGSNVENIFTEITHTGTENDPYTIREAYMIGCFLVESEYSETEVYMYGAIDSSYFNKNAETNKLYQTSVFVKGLGQDANWFIKVSSMNVSSELGYAYVNDTMVVKGYIHNYDSNEQPIIDGKALGDGTTAYPELVSIEERGQSTIQVNSSSLIGLYTTITTSGIDGNNKATNASIVSITLVPSQQVELAHHKFQVMIEYFNQSTGWLDLEDDDLLVEFKVEAPVMRVSFRVFRGSSSISETITALDSDSSKGLYVTMAGQVYGLETNQDGTYNFLLVESLNDTTQGIKFNNVVWTNNEKSLANGGYLAVQCIVRKVGDAYVADELSNDAGTTLSYYVALEHAGTAQDPLTATEAYDLAAIRYFMPDKQTTDRYYVTGTISSDPTVQYCNFYLHAYGTDDNNSDDLYVYGLLNQNTKYAYGSYKQISELPVKNGDTVLLYAYLKAYVDSNEYITLELVESVLMKVNDVEVAAIEDPVTEHEGTLADPYTVADALALAANLKQSGYNITGDYVMGYYKGYVVDQGTDNNTYMKNIRIADAMNAESTLLVYTVNTTDEFMHVGLGDLVIIHGYLMNYSGTVEISNAKGPNDEAQVYPEFSSVTRANGTISVANNSSENATVTLSAQSGVNGSTFTFTVTVDEGYAIVEVKVNGAVVEVVEGTYTGVVRGTTIVTVETTTEGVLTAKLNNSKITTTKTAADYTASELTEVLNLDNTIFNVVYDKNGASTEMALRDDELRMYATKNSTKGNKITVSVAEGYVIESITINFASGYSSTAVVYAGNGTGGVEAVEGVYTINASSFTLFNDNSGVSSNTQVRFYEITIVYSQTE